MRSRFNNFTCCRISLCFWCHHDFQLWTSPTKSTVHTIHSYSISTIISIFKHFSTFSLVFRLMEMFIFIVCSNHLILLLQTHTNNYINEWSVSHFGVGFFAIVLTIKRTNVFLSIYIIRFRRSEFALFPHTNHFSFHKGEKLTSERE